MLKSIPKSNISKRAFQVYKQWEFTNTDYPLINASSSLDDANYSLYRSIKAKYYNTSSFDAFKSFGRYKDSYTFAGERNISDEIFVIAIPQTFYGEEIKPSSVTISSNDNSYRDDGYGALISDSPIYTIYSIDFQLSTIVLIDGDNQTFTGTINYFDVHSGEMSATFLGVSDSFIVINLDLNNGLMKTATPLDYPGVGIDEQRYGNIFYDDGLIVFTQEVGPSYTLNYRSTKTIYETEVLITARAGEFNYSQNPSAVTVTLSGSYDFVTTAITNGEPAGTRSIKEVLDITQRQSYTGSIGSSVGSWNDYFESSSTDPTGSYLAPYITTIGLYNDQNEMVAVAKLPQPIKNLPDYDINFIVRFDT